MRRLSDGMRVLGIDPGPEQSAYALIRAGDLMPISKGKVDSGVLRDTLNQFESDHIAIEMIQSYGMPVGEETFVTCFWVGRFFEVALSPVSLVYRKKAEEVDAITSRICGSAKASDANIRRAIIDMYPRSGGGKEPAIGTKKKPGPLYGFAKDQWQALAVAITWVLTMRDRDERDN